MPVTYYSSTGAVSFAPVPARDQAVGPLDVSVELSPPDETIAGKVTSERVNRSEGLPLAAASAAIAALLAVIAISAG